MSKLLVEINYVRLAQFLKMVKHFLERAINELDKAAIEAGHLENDRRNGDRRNGDIPDDNKEDSET